MVRLATRFAEGDRYALETFGIAARDRKDAIGKSLLAVKDPNAALFELMPKLAVARRTRRRYTCRLSPWPRPGTPGAALSAYRQARAGASTTRRARHDVP